MTEIFMKFNDIQISLFYFFQGMACNYQNIRTQRVLHIFHPLLLKHKHYMYIKQPPVFLSFFLLLFLFPYFSLTPSYSLQEGFWQNSFPTQVHRHKLSTDNFKI